MVVHLGHVLLENLRLKPEAMVSRQSGDDNERGEMMTSRLISISQQRSLLVTSVRFLLVRRRTSIVLVDRLQITIPWLHLNTRATEVHLSGLYLLIVPKGGTTVTRSIGEETLVVSCRIQSGSERTFRR